MPASKIAESQAGGELIMGFSLAISISVSTHSIKEDIGTYTPSIFGLSCAWCFYLFSLYLMCFLVKSYYSLLELNPIILAYICIVERDTSY